MISAVLPTYNRAPLAFVSGAGSWLTAEDGSRYLDLGAGIAVNALGHAHPALVKTLTDQAAKLWHVSNVYRIPEQEALAKALVDKTFADTVFFTNSGTETAELAIKMARKYHYEKGAPRAEIIAFEGAFHGRSTGAIAAAGSEKMTKGYGPLMPGFRQLPFGDHAALKAAITDQTCAVIIEPIQGEGGIRTMPDACLKGLRDLCDQHGALLIFDEVQCGMGRTGKWFAHQWSGVVPDVMPLAKGLGSGVPIGAVVAGPKAAHIFQPGNHGTTFGGNPLAMRAGVETIRIMEEDKLLDHVAQVSAHLHAALHRELDGVKGVKEIRGQGLMIGIDLDRSCGALMQRALEAGLLLSVTADSVVRLVPPLIITEAEADEVVGILAPLIQTFLAEAP